MANPGYGHDENDLKANRLLGFLKIQYFERLNNISRSNFLFEDFFGNILLSWTEAAENNQEASFKFLDEVPKRFVNLKLIQDSFLHCYFDISKTEITFEKII